VAALSWVMMAIAIWHFTVFLPDRFWAGIVGAFVWSIVGAIAFGFLIHLGDLPSRDDTNVLTALESIPGAVAGLAAVYFIGLRREQRDAELHGGLT